LRQKHLFWCLEDFLKESGAKWEDVVDFTISFDTFVAVVYIFQAL
jgi:hypothetical protein